MNSFAYLGSFKSSLCLRWSRFSAITAKAVFLFALTVTILTNSIIAGASPSIPVGYSSEIVHVKFRAGTAVYSPEAALPRYLRDSVAYMGRLFSISEQKLKEIRVIGGSHSGQMVPDLNMWFQITLKPGTNPGNFIENLKHLASVETVEPAPLPAPPPAVTPNFTADQGYLNAAPGGIDARFSWTIPGGNGSAVKIFDVEYSWNQIHEDLSKANGIPLLLNSGDSAVDPFNNNNHGTAVLGEIIADNDTKGVTGISWGANVGLAPVKTANLGYNPANAIVLAVAAGSPGDVILIEQQAPVCGLPDFGPSEWISSVFDAIQTAVANRFVVVEAAGNGNVNLDQAACGTTFDRTVRDSGAIIVGAGRPPNSGADRQRESFSTYGSRVDLQGWGSGVTTTGYGLSYTNPDDPTNPNFWYTSFFSGTSSASPIVTGAAADLQGIALSRFGTPLTAFQIRELLVQTGSPQLGDTAAHIGPRPNLREAISLIPVDTTPPLVTILASPRTLWPPNGKMVPVIISGTITDSESGVDTSTAAYAVTDEYGSIQPSGTVTLGANGSYSFTIQLQASRNGNDKDGRQYIITVGAQDDAGNEGSAATGVVVPHDQGKK
jgi:serine protease